MAHARGDFPILHTRLLEMYMWRLDSVLIIAERSRHRFKFRAPHCFSSGKFGYKKHQARNIHPVPALREPVVLAKTLRMSRFPLTRTSDRGNRLRRKPKRIRCCEGFLLREESRAVEQIELTKRLWREEHVNHEGEFLKTIDLNVGPRPVQIPNPPIWMGGAARGGS